MRLCDTMTVIWPADELVSNSHLQWHHIKLVQSADARIDHLCRLRNRKAVTTSAPASRVEHYSRSAHPCLWARRCGHGAGVLTFGSSADTVRCWYSRLIHDRARSADSVTEKPLPQALLRAASSTLSECTSESSDTSVRPPSGCFDIGQVGRYDEVLRHPLNPRSGTLS